MMMEEEPFSGRQSGGVSHKDIHDYFIGAIKQRSKKPEMAGLAFTMDPARLMAVIEQQVQSNNATLLERVLDKEIFERVFKGVRQQFIPGKEGQLAFDVSKLVGLQSGQGECELQDRIREISRDLMRQMQFADDSDGE